VTFRGHLKVTNAKIAYNFVTALDSPMVTKKHI
jgi:hypothetical protein